MKATISVLALFVIGLCGHVSAQFDILDEHTFNDYPNHERTAEPIDISSFDGTLFEVLDQVFDSVRHDPTIIGTNAALMTPEGEIWTRAGGWAATLPMNDTLRTDHLMGIGSITKTFVSATILSMYEDGLLDLDDLISDYVGPYPNVSIWTRIRHLLCHRSGINDYLNENPAGSAAFFMYPDSIWVIDSVLNNYVLQPNFPVNQTYSYSNTNFLLAGRVIESITGRPWYEVVRERVIEPMGLTQTFAYPFELPDSSELSHAFGELDSIFVDYQGYGISDFGTFSMAASAGCIISNPHDIARFSNQLHGGHFLNDTTLERAHADYYPESSSLHVGLGMFRRQFENVVAWGHGGSIVYLSLAYYFPELDMTLVIQQNESRSGDDYSDDMYDMFDALLEAYLQYTPTTSSDHPVQLDEFAMYPNPASDQLTFEWRPTVPGGSTGKCAIATLQGQQAMQFDIVPGVNHVQIGHLLPGTYVVMLNGAARKVIVH